MKAAGRGLFTITITLLSGVILFLTAGAILDASEFIRGLSILAITTLSAVAQFFLLIPWCKSLDDAELRTRVLLQNTTKERDHLSETKDPSNLTELLQEIEKTISETLQKERAALDNAVDVICVIAITGKILSVNKACREVWGYSQDELIGHFLNEFLEKDSKDTSLNPFLGAEESIEKIFVENRFLKKDGQIIDLLWSAHWSASDSGLFCVAHDITIRKRTEELLKASEERIRLLLESVPAGIAIVSEWGYFELMNKTAFELSEYDESSIVNLRAKEVFPFCKDPFNSKSFVKSATEAFHLLSRSGARIPCELSVKEFIWNDTSAVLIIFLDLRQKYAVEQAKREFIAMVSHDLRSPLNSINAVLTYLSDGHAGELSEKGRNLVAKTVRESLRLIALINDLLDIEKIKSGKFVANLSESSILDLAKRSVDVVERSASLQGIDIELRGDDYVCLCDGGRIIQVIVNLLDNAIKYSKAGQTVRIDMTKSERGCLVTISNRGRPIPEEKVKTIFESFEQINPGFAQERKGTGLGLAICKSIIEQHGEKIWVESSEESGTKFIFSLGSSFEEAVRIQKELKE